MNEFIEKLIGRLEEAEERANRHYNYGDKTAYRHSIEIVNQLAEEYENDCILVHTQGLDMGIQCAMCTNPMKSDRGCDGGCSVNKEMYKKVLDVIERHTHFAPYQPKGE